MVGLNTDGPARDRVLRLMAEKDRLESEIRDQNMILQTNNVGMHDPLVDSEGYPRTDIDVYKVRHARHNIICLQNDHKAIMRRIEQGLAEVHAELRPDGVNQAPLNQNGSAFTNGHALNGVSHSGDDIMSIRENDVGFATITFVHEGSPADVAGLQPQDEVFQFGSINIHNFVDIMQVHNVVTHSVGQNVRLLVRRNNCVLNLSVTPRPWGQPGLLGCQIVRRVD
ncbi:hypothetical protein O0L34_g10136 [Tuta absoluta]|nr:hypothetical protein O0L34_g10136 [Tuta absoluta]